MRLNRERIVAAALELLEEEGLERLTLRRLAARLGVQSPSLYWHVNNKRELLDELAEEMLARRFPELPEPDPTADWRSWLCTIALDYRSAMLVWRDGGLVAAGVNPRRAATFARLSAHVLEQLVETYGLEAAEAALAMSTVFIYTTGVVIEEQTSPSRAELASEGIALDAHLEEGLKAEVAELQEQTTTSEEWFRCAVRWILR